MKTSKGFLLGIGVAALMLSACTGSQQTPQLTVSGLDPAKFDTVINEKPVKLYTLTNANGMEVCITNYGGRVVSLVVPDKDGNPTDVVLGFDNIAQYADTLNTTYKVTSDNILDMTWEAETDKPTIINQTNHNYYNLSGDFHTGCLRSGTLCQCRQLHTQRQALYPHWRD